MPRSHKLSRLFHRNTGPTNKSTPGTSTRKIAPLTVACVAVLAAIAFSVSVESRSSGWLWRSSGPPPGGVSKSETVKNTKHSSSVNANHSVAPVPVPFASPTVTATKTDSLFTDVDNDGKADPGDTLKYTVGINATGGDATGVTFTDTVDPNTTFVAGSLRTTPLARPDSYTATGNIRIQVPAGSGVLANDQDFDGVGPAISVTAGTFSSAQGGDVVIAADGSFSYNPPAGFEGSDTFTYTLNDNDTPNQTDTGTVTVTVSGMIWFINNGVGSTGDGRLTSPFKTLADFQAVNNGTGNHPAANDNIFVYESATDYVGPVTLLSGQKFIGQDATDTLANIAGITLAPNSNALPTTSPGAPFVNITSAGNGITLGTNNTLRGFTGGNAATDISGSSFGTANISDVTLNGNGQTLNLTTGTLNGTFGSLSSSSSATTGLSLTGVGGSLTTGSTTVTNPTGIGISVDTSSLTLGFANTSVSGSGGTGVSLTTNTGAITFADLDISPGANQRALLATNNSSTITATSGTISNSGATAVEITRTTSTTPLNLTFTSITSSGGTANGITLSNTSGSFTVVGDGANTSVGGNSTGGTISGKSGADGSTTNGSGVFLNNATNVTLRRMTINGTNQNYGVRGTTVNGFTFEFNTIAGTNGTSNAGGSEEGSIRFDGLVGSASIGSSNIGGGATFNVFVLNTSGTLDRLTMSNNTFGLISASIGNDNVDVTASSSATVKVTASGNTFGGTRADFFEAIANNNATLDAVVRQNKFNDGQAIIPGGGTAVSIRSGSAGNTSTATTTFDVSCNRMNGGDANAYDTVGMFFAKGQDLGTMTGTVVNNTIGPAKTNANADGIFVRSAGQGSVNILVQNNTISGYGNAGLHFQNNDGSSTMNASVFGNVLSSPNVNNFAGMFMDNGATATDTSTMNAVVGSASNAALQNTLQGAGVVIDVSLSNFNASTHFNLSKNGSAAVTAANVIADDNVDTPSVDTSGGAGPITLVTTLPTVPATPATCSTPAGPVTSGLLSADSTSSSPSQDVVKGDSILYAAKGENKDSQLPVNKLSPSEASAMFQAAISRWADAGLSARTLAKLQSLTVEVADLPEGQLATANSSKIVLDETAAGYGWFFDTTPSDDNEFQVPVPDKELQTTDSSAANNRIDLLTVLMRQLSSQVSRGKSASLVGPAAWLMENTLGTGTRRAPSFKKTDEAKPQAAPGVAKIAKPVRSAVDQQKHNTNYQQVAAVNSPRSGRVLRNHAMAPMTVADVLLSIGTLPAGKTITITFNAMVKDPFPGPGATVCNQGSVTGTNFATVLTDDPDVVGTSDPTCTPIDLQADLAVTKTDTPDPVIAGTNLTYTIDFINNGPNASGATVTDATPAGTTFVSAAVTTGTGWGAPTTPAVGGTGNVVFSKASVASGETAQFQIVVKVGSSVAPATIITNNATAATTGATDPVPGNNTGTATTTVIAQADLSITKTDGVTEKVPGTGVTYTIVVTNNGPSDANGVSVADSFPSDLTGVAFTSVAAGGATGNTAAGSGNISDTLNMPTGSSVTYTVNATIKSSATGSLSNTATVTAPGNVTDNDTANNSATDTDTLTPQADLSVTKTDGVTSKVPGTSVTYTIVVSNSGPSDAPGSSVADTFPSDLTGVTFTSVAAGGATGNTASGSANITDTLSLPSGASVTYTVNATVKSSATGSLSNTATVTAGAGVTDPTPGNNSATDTDTLTPQGDLSITKTDGVTSKVPGTSVTYTIVVTNNGPSDAPGTSVADTFPAILTGVSYTSVAAGGATGNTAGPASGSINDTVSLPSGASVTYTVNATVQASATGTLSNTAMVTAGAGVTDPTPGNNSATDTDTLTASADVSVTKTDSPDPVVVNNNITYTITVTNNGPSDAQSLSLSDAVPANTTLVSASLPSGWLRTDAVPAGGTGTLTYTRTTLPASASSIFTVVVNVTTGTANGTTITNTANVSSATTDPTPGNNSATATTLVQSNADLAISKQRSPSGTIDAGSNVTYTIGFINNGPAPASNVTVSDTLPAGVTVVSQTNPGGWTCNTIPAGGTGTITCTKASVANGETATLTVVVNVSCSVANGATINNTATISSGAGSPPDNNSSNNSSTASFTVNNPAVTVTASVTTSQLPQNNHELINVGLAALASGGTANCPPGPLTVQVFGNEDDQTPTANNEVFSPDAKDIAVNTLRLRAERVNTGNGRVYLIVVRSGSSFSTVTVIVPKSSSNKDMNAINAAAAAAKSFADSHNGAAPAGYFVIGDGPVIGNKQ